MDQGAGNAAKQNPLDETNPAGAGKDGVRIPTARLVD
jgi:hypothetical protein